MSMLRLSQVSCARGEGVRAVRAIERVDLALAAGDVALLEGPSGAGKTTLLLVAAGLLAPSSGDVLVGGESLIRLDSAARRRRRAKRIGFVFQQKNLLRALTVRENVLLSAELADVPQSVARTRARSSAESEAAAKRAGSVIENLTSPRQAPAHAR